MAARVGKRIEVRLDEEHRQMLERILECRGTTVSEFVRQSIEALDSEVRLERMRALIEEARRDPFPVPDDPEELRRILEDTYNPFYGKPQFKDDFPSMVDEG